MHFNYDRDQDSSILLEKPQVFIDDGQKAAEKSKFDNKNTTKAVAAGGDVVYDASDDVKSAKAPPPLIGPSNTETKTKSPTYLTPPPPPSTATSAPTTTNTSTSNNSSVPALF